MEGAPILRYELLALKVSDRSQAKLAYLFELGVNAELREEDGTHAGEHIYRVGRLCAALVSKQVVERSYVGSQRSPVAHMMLERRACPRTRWTNTSVSRAAELGGQSRIRN